MQYETVSGGMLGLALTQWLNASPEEATYGQVVRSFKAVIHNSDFLAQEYTMLAEIAAMVRGMAGAHGYAYCKMIMAQNERPKEGLGCVQRTESV